MKQAANRELFAYWNALRGERMAPERNDIDPAAIKTLLLDTFILEVDAAGTLPLRVAGARLSALFTRELRGDSFPFLFDAEDRPGLLTLVEAVLGDPAPAVAGVRAEAEGPAPLELELLLLPLRHHGRTHARVLGSLVPASTPMWMGLMETTPLRLGAWRILGRETASGATVPLPGEGAVNPSAAPGFFRVFAGGRRVDGAPLT